MRKAERENEHRLHSRKADVWMSLRSKSYVGSIFNIETHSRTIKT